MLVKLKKKNVILNVTLKNMLIVNNNAYFYMMRHSKLLVLSFYLFVNIAYSQTIFEQDIIRGGVTGGGFSTCMGSGVDSILLNVPQSSIIKKVYLFSYYVGGERDGIFVNGKKYYFNLNEKLTSFSHKNLFFSPINLCFKNITKDVSFSKFKINIPSQSMMPFEGQFTVYIYIVYENPALPLTHYSIILNDKDLIGKEQYNVTGLPKINTNNPVGFALYTDRTDDIDEGSYVYVNNNLLGLVGGADSVNYLWGCGTKGHFYYQNDSLFGLDDDTPDSLMMKSDGLADISSYLSNNTNGFNFELIHQFYPTMPPAAINLNLAYFLTYTSPCDTFSTTLSKDTTICFGQTAQLQATGGTKYEWLPQQNLSCYNCPNPTFTGTQTTTYTCRIYNTDSCSKVLPVRIIVQNPKADSLLLTKAFCPNNNGTAQIFADTLFWGELNFTLNGNTNYTGNFTNLTPGWHNYAITDTLGCIATDSLYIPAQVNVTAAFTSNPKTGFAPLTVNFTNHSNNSTSNYWLITNQNGDTIFTTTNQEVITNNFQQSGTYTTTLIACNNSPYCCDTISFTIVVEDSAGIIFPNVFSPNQDGINDDYQIQLQAAWHFETLEAQIYNRWGEVVQQRSFNSEALAGDSTSLSMTKKPTTLTLWDGFTLSGKPATEGTYFIVVNATLKDGKKTTQKIAVSLVR